MLKKCDLKQNKRLTATEIAAIKAELLWEKPDLYPSDSRNGIILWKAVAPYYDESTDPQHEFYTFHSSDKEKYETRINFLLFVLEAEGIWP